jgi:repressor of nif and glnA expression
MIRTERKYIEILRILKEHQEPVGAKRLSELMAERGFVLSDRAVQYYLRYLDSMGFTEKVGNLGRILTEAGIEETNAALVGDRIGFIISKLERLAFRSNFDPQTCTGDVAYNLTVTPSEQAHEVTAAFNQVIEAKCGFFNAYKIVDKDPRIPEGYIGIMTICSTTMDGVFQRHGIPTSMAFGGRLAFHGGQPKEFLDIIGYRGTTIDPLQLFISAGLTNLHGVVTKGEGIALANVREVPLAAEQQVEEIGKEMRSCGFVFPIRMGTAPFNLRPEPFRLSVIAFSGMNFIAHGAELGIPLKTEIGAGNIQFSRFSEGS